MTKENPDLESKDKELTAKPSIMRHLPIGTAIVVALILVGALYAQYHSSQNLKSRSKTLTTENTAYKRDKLSLEKKNANLQKAVQTLQDQLAAGQQQSAVSTPKTSTQTAVITGKMVITAVKDQPGTDFALGSYKPPMGTLPDGTVRVVYLTLTNPTDVPQTYQALQFKATTDTGVIVGPQRYAPYESTVWDQTKLAPGGTTQVTVLFDTDKNYVTLNWSPDGSSTPIVVSFPKPSDS